MASTTDSSLFDGGADFDWIKYTTNRPVYSSAFYDRIWGYHRSHSNHWTLAHDVGTGPGNVAEVLSARFDKVIASDPSGFHTAVAKRRLSASNVTVEQCRAEDLVTLIGLEGQGKADLITLAECIPLMDAAKAFSGFSKLLRPGGTLAIWFYGKPIFAEKGQERSQQIYNQIAGKAFSRIFPIKGTVWQQAYTVMASWLDAIGFSSEDWTDVQRTKWSHDKPLCFLPEEYFDFELQYKNSGNSLTSLRPITPLNAHPSTKDPPFPPSHPPFLQLTMPHLLEIEQKFSFNLANLAPLIRKAGFSPFIKNTSEYNTHAFHDTYYDSHNKLSAAGLWLRKRRHLRYTPTLLSSFSLPSRYQRPGTTEERVEEEEKEEWEAKQSVAPGHSFLRSTFSETKDHNQIAELMRAHFPLEHRRRSLGFDNAFGLHAIARFETKRLTLRAVEGDDDRFAVVLDVTDFGHEVGEVEVMAEDAEGAHREIEAFCGRYPWFFDMRKPRGKLTAYFERFGYPK